VLRGLGGVALGLPFLDAMTSTPARAATGPKRLVFFFVGNGTAPATWRPKTSGTQVTLTSSNLGDLLSPLSGHASQLLLLSGIDNQASYDWTNLSDSGHGFGMTSLLTGVPPIAHTQTGHPTGGGISIDQFLAQKIGAQTKFASLEIGVQSGTNTNGRGMCFLGPQQSAPRESDPAALFDKLFGELGAAPAEGAALAARRKSMLDFVADDLEALKARLGAADLAALDHHLTSVRDIEKQLEFAAPSCTAPTLAPPVGSSDSAQTPVQSKAMLDILAAALACDLTRVATLQYRGMLGGSQTFPFLPSLSGEAFHDISHKSDPDYTTQMTTIGAWFASQLAYLLDKLASTPDAGGGTVLDNTVIVWVSEVAQGNSHSRKGMRLLLAGSCGGYFETGRYLDLGQVQSNRLLNTLCDAMDVPGATFGESFGYQQSMLDLG
jgi:hypothetical protein